MEVVLVLAGDHLETTTLAEVRHSPEAVERLQAAHTWKQQRERVSRWRSIRIYLSCPTGSVCIPVLFQP